MKRSNKHFFQSIIFSLCASAIFVVLTVQHALSYTWWQALIIFVTTGVVGTLIATRDALSLIFEKQPPRTAPSHAGDNISKEL